MLSNILAKFKIDKFDLIPLTLYTLSVLACLAELKEVGYIYANHKGSVEYNPYLWTLYIALPAAAFITVINSSFMKVATMKFKYIKFSFACLLIIIFGGITQAVNKYILAIYGLVGPKIETVPVELLNDATRAMTFYFPIIFAAYFIIKFKVFINDRDTAALLPGLDFGLNAKDTEPVGHLTCEVTICTDAKTNKPVITPETKRLEATLIQGATGTGKTSTLLLPMSSIDLERKYFFKELSKEIAIRALDKGYAYVDAPFSNEEINKNFSLKFLKPLRGKEELFEKELNEMIKYKDEYTGEVIYKDLGIGVVDPDGEYAKNFRKVAANFGIDCIIVDPMDDNSVGINPFIGKEPAKIASIIANVLKGMYESENPADSNLFFQQVTQQAIENLSIILKVMYPRMHGGLTPNLEDMLEMLHNYDLVEEMCEELKKDPVLVQDYKILIAYFEKNFYKPPLNDRGIPISGSVGSGRRATEQFLYGAITQLDNLLRRKDVKRLLCSRSNNIDFDDILENGKCLTVCSRRGPLGGILSKAFGMFFILAFQDAVLRRPGNEKTRLPFFIYIDEFPDYVNKETETCFTLFRKYRCGLIIAIQNLSQLERTKSMRYYKQVVLANTKTQIIFGDTNKEDTEYWADAFGKEIIWSIGNSGTPESPSQSQSLVWEHIHSPSSIHYQSFKAIKYKTKSSKGKTIIGDGKTNFIDEKYFKEQPIKVYNFEKYKIYQNTAEREGEPAPQYSSISTSYSNVGESEQAIPTAFSEVPPIYVDMNGQVAEKRVEPGISLGDNIQTTLKNDKISNEEMSALKELITEIHGENDEMDVDVEMGTSLSSIQAVPEIMNVPVDSKPDKVLESIKVQEGAEKMQKPMNLEEEPIKEIKLNFEPVVNEVEPPESNIIDVQPIEEDKVENPNVLDKAGKIKIEVKQG